MCLIPELWNISNNDILSIEMSDDAFLVAYANELVAAIPARNMRYPQWKVNKVMIR